VTLPDEPPGVPELLALLEPQAAAASTNTTDSMAKHRLFTATLPFIEILYRFSRE
jgi:hypothetical protein